MSVTFQVEAGTPTSFKVSCHCEGSVSLEFQNYTGANSFLQNSPNHVLEGCDEEGYCAKLHIELIDDTVDAPWVNMSNFNASSVLEVLGVDIEDSGYSGVFDPDDLLARVNIGLAVAPESAERLTYAEGNMVIGGRKEGYVQDRLHDVIEVAEHAKRMGREVVWC